MRISTIMAAALPRALPALSLSLVLLLTACAGAQPVHLDAWRNGFAAPAGHTYALQALPPVTSTSSATLATSATSVPPTLQAAPQWLAQALAGKGLRAAPADSADYLVEYAYASRPQNVHLQAECSGVAEGACEDFSAPRDFFHRKRFVHALTLDFIERSSGTVRYRISAGHTDSDAAGDQALHALINCALAEFPLAPETRRDVPECAP